MGDPNDPVVQLQPTIINVTDVLNGLRHKHNQNHSGELQAISQDLGDGENDNERERCRVQPAAEEIAVTGPAVQSGTHNSRKLKARKLAKPPKASTTQS